MEWQAAAGLGDLLQEGAIEDMYSNNARPQFSNFRRPIFVRLHRPQVAVLDDLHLAIDAHDIANLLLGKALAHDLSGQLALGQQVITDQQRIADFGQWVSICA